MVRENIPFETFSTRTHDGRTMIGHVVVCSGVDQGGSDVVAIWQLNTTGDNTCAWVVPTAEARNDSEVARRMLNHCAQRSLTAWDPTATMSVLDALTQVAGTSAREWAATAVAVPELLAEIAAIRAAYDKRIAEERQHRKNAVAAEWPVDIPDPVPTDIDELREYARLVRPAGGSAVGEALLTAGLLRWCRSRWQENMVVLARRAYLQEDFGRPRLLPAMWELRLANAYAG